jgi:hypothetical protein
MNNEFWGVKYRGGGVVVFINPFQEKEKES